MLLSTYVRPAWRSLRRSPAFTITASTTLVLGLGAAIAIFAVINGVLLRPLPYGHPDRLVGAWFDLPGVSIHKAQQTSGTYFTFKKLARSLSAIGVYYEGSVNVSDPKGAAEPQHISAGWLSASTIPMLEVPPVVGRSFSEAEDQPKGPNVVMISEGMWRTRFASDPAILERKLEVNGRTYDIVGVMPRRFRFPAAYSQLWFPIQLDPHDPFPGGFNYNSVARLAPNVRVADAERELVQVLPRMKEDFPNLAPGVSTQMLLDQAKPRPFLIPLKEDVTGGISTTLWLVAAAAGLVLLVACANVTNLILVRADARQRELAVREALGAGRGRVLVHFLGESVVITAIAGIVGTAIAAMAVRLLVSAGPAEIPRLAEVHIDAVTVLFAIVASVIVAVLCSAIPALRLGRVHLSKALREGGRSGTAGRVQQRLRSTLVAAQIALALVALAGSGLLVRTFFQLNAVRPGFNPERVVTQWLSIPEGRYPNDSAVMRFYANLAERARALPGVQSVGLTSRLPLVGRGMNQNPFYPENDPSYAQKIPPLQIYAVVDGDYFKTMGIPLIAGKTFERLEQQRFGEAIISQATAWQFYRDSTGQSAIGKRFQDLPNGGTWYTIVGVVGTVRDTALAAQPSQSVYFPEVPSSSKFNGQFSRTMALVVRTAGDPTTMQGTIQHLVRELDPTLPVFDAMSMSRVLSVSVAQLRFTIIVLGAAALVTLVLGAIGLYGVMAYIVALRTRELGVRIALGAAPSDVVSMLTRQGVLLTAAGIAGGLALFVLVARFLRTLLFGVAPMDPVTLLGASLLLVVIAALASWIPARRTSKLDPAEVLRAE